MQKLNETALLKSLELSLAHSSRTNKVKSSRTGTLSPPPILQIIMVKGSIVSRWHDRPQPHIASHPIAITSVYKRRVKYMPSRPRPPHKSQSNSSSSDCDFVPYDSEKLGKSVKNQTTTKWYFKRSSYIHTSNEQVNRTTWK